MATSMLQEYTSSGSDIGVNNYSALRNQGYSASQIGDAVKQRGQQSIYDYLSQNYKAASATAAASPAVASGGTTSASSAPAAVASPAAVTAATVTDTGAAQRSQQQQYLAQLQSQQQTQAGQAATATAGAQASATAQGVLGQDVFSQKLAGMASGQFSPDDPSYQWRYQQGQQAVERSNAAQGLLGSGNVAIALQQYGQGAASQEYSAQFARMLQGSQNATSQYTAAYNSLAQIMGQQTNIGQLGNALAGTGVAQGQLEQSYYAANLGAATSRYGIDVGAATSRYGTDVGAQTSRYATDVGAATSRYATDVGLTASLASSATSRANAAGQTGLGYAELGQRSQESAAQQQGMADLYSSYQSGGLFGGTATPAAQTTGSTSTWGTANQPQAMGSDGGDVWGSWSDPGAISITPVSGYGSGEY